MEDEDRKPAARQEEFTVINDFPARAPTDVPVFRTVSDSHVTFMPDDPPATISSRQNSSPIPRSALLPTRKDRAQKNRNEQVHSHSISDPYGSASIPSSVMTASSVLSANDFVFEEWQRQKNWNALHVAMSNKAEDWKIKLLLELDPDMAIQQNLSGNTPIHVGLQCKADEKALLVLILKDGDRVARIPNADGELPLHIACERSAPYRVISDLVKTYPDAIMAQTNEYNHTPLHCLMSSKIATLAVTNILLEERPNAAKIRDKYGRTPLMVGFDSEAPDEVLEAIYEKFPAAAGMKPAEDSSTFGRNSGSSGLKKSLNPHNLHPNIPQSLMDKFKSGTEVGNKMEEELKQYAPNGFRLRHHFTILHVALSKHAPIELISFLLETSPKMALRQTTEGNCPLIEGLISGASEEALNVILNACSESCSVVNNNNECALHYAVQKSSPSLVLRILRAFPVAAKLQSLNEDEMPLHRLMVSPHNALLVQDLLAANKDAAKVRDRYGRTPLHTAMNNRVAEGTILAVFEAYKEAFGIEDAQRRTPMDDSQFVSSNSSHHDHFYYMQGEFERAHQNRGINVNDVLREYKPDNSQAGQGWNTLHVAMSKGADSNAIDILLQSSPNMARKQNEAGNFPLFEGLLGHANEQSLIDVLDAYPDACKFPNNNGEYAIHYAAHSTHLIVEAILQVYTDAINIQASSSLATPLHVLLGRKDAPVYSSLIRLLTTETSIKARDMHGNTPLHVAIKNSLRQQEIETLLLAFHGASKIADNQGSLPLHSAIQRELPELLLLNLLHAFPEAAEMTCGEEEFLPLHLAMKYRSGSEFTNALILKNGEAPLVKTKKGSTALSLALTYSAEFDSLMLLLNSEAAKTKDSENTYPLHIAMMKGAPTTAVMALIDFYPDALDRFNKQGYTPIHSGIVPAIHVLKERYPNRFRPHEVRGGSLPPRASSQSEIGRGKSPLEDLMTILYNLNYILENRPLVAEQKDKRGYFPLLHFCMIFNPSVIKLASFERQQATEAITDTLEKIYQAYPPAAEIVGPFVGNPINILVGECSIAKSVSGLRNNETCKRLRILLQKARDGRALQTLCTLHNSVPLWSFFSLFDESGVLSSKSTEKRLALDLNKEVIKGWCVLDILADFDTPDSSSVLLQIIVEQKSKLDGEKQIFCIKNEDGKELVEFASLSEVSNIVRTRIADRAKLANSSPKLRKWGQEYGRFLRRYRLERQPKHVSETCMVVFGTEAIKEKDGRIIENPVALKLMCSRKTFYREVYKRREVAKGRNTDTQHIVPIKACFSSVGIDDFECTWVPALQSELEPYSNIRLHGSDLKYVIVMDCGAGYDLHDFISHQNVAGKDLFTVTSIAKEIAICLKFLNETCGIIHGDVKARNFVAKGVGHIGFAAIDLDNSSSIGRECAGKKRTSSGYLPPEQAAVEAFERYNDSMSSDAEQGNSLCTPQNKPEKIVATAKYDMWCFGVLLYFLCTGKQLFNVDTKEDVDDEDLIRIRDWNEVWKQEKLAKVDMKWPRNLLDSLLQKEPEKRPENWTDVVDELNRITNREDNIVYDRIVIFQSAPLVYKDERTKDILPLPLLDFNRESVMLREALKDAEKVGCTIHVVIETASLDRLNAFMQTENISQVFHFSGHGTRNYMAWEDERGGSKMINENQLRRQISGIGSFLKCVFISTCHSEWVGNAFVDEGVPHAVCCPVDECLQDMAASEFTRNFYRALACRKTLLKAFEEGRKAVRESPHVKNSEVEAQKFLLLPEKPEDPSYHDVHIFYSSEIVTLQDSVKETVQIGLPKYKDLIVGRDVLKYSILDNLFSKSTIDVVQVYGKEGLGKSALVASVCDYILQRPRSFPLDYIILSPPKSQIRNSEDPLYQNICNYIRLMIDDSGAFEEAKVVRDSLSELVKEKSLLLIFDFREYQKCKKVGEILDRKILERFQKAMYDLLEITTPKFLKVILITEKPWIEWRLSGRSELVPVWELDLASAVTLFAHRIPEDLRRNHPELNSRTALIAKITNPPEEIQEEDDFEERDDELWDRFLGSGIPKRCCDIARGMSEEGILELLSWWEPRQERESKIPLDDMFL